MPSVLLRFACVAVILGLMGLMLPATVVAQPEGETTATPETVEPAADQADGPENNAEADPAADPPSPDDAAPAAQGNPAPPEADQPAPAAPDQAVIVRVVQVSGPGATAGPVDGERGEFKPVEEGQVFGLGTEFRTGPFGMIRLVTDPGDHRISIDRFTNITLLEAVQQGGVIETELGMKIGRVSYRVEAGGLEHETRIKVPGTTLAVRDTDVGMEYSGAFGAIAIVNEANNAEVLREARGLRLISRGRLTRDDDSSTDNEQEQTTSEAGERRARSGPERRLLQRRANLQGQDMREIDIRDQLQLSRARRRAFFANDARGGRANDIFASVDIMSLTLSVRVQDAAFGDPQIDSDRLRATLVDPFGDPLGTAGGFVEEFSLTSEGTTLNLSNIPAGRSFLRFQAVDLGGSGELSGLQADVFAPADAQTPETLLLLQENQTGSLEINRR